ncbi:MAG TPA: DNA repair protein RadC [Planctomycetota bacterium]|nr:DNA repair protein RadC [Planctomycetota bacterium]
MSARSEQIYQGVQRTLRAEMGKALSPLLKRWRYALSSDYADIPLRPGTARLLIRFGLLDAGQTDDERAKIHRTLLTEISRTSGDAPGVAAAWLDLFAEGEYGALERGICADEPQCAKCGLKEKCRYLATGAKDERASGAELAEKLMRSTSASRENISASDVLAFLTAGQRCGAADYARAEAALKNLGGLRGVFEANSAALQKIGFDSAAQARISALARLCAHWAAEQSERGKTFSKGSDFYDHFHLRLRDHKKEVFYVALLDQKNALIAEERVSEGSLTETLVHPREVFAQAVLKRAAAIAVIHNHPSGDPTPSANDKAITKRLDAAAQLLGIRLLDHIIIGDGQYASFVEKGLLR